MAQKIQVLLVDDAKEIRDTERMLLSYARDIEIVGEAVNGKEACEMAASFKPDIVLMDINMPVMDGIEATQKIADTLPDVSVVIVSVQEEFQALKRALQAGAKEYLLKPFSAESMLTAIRNVYSRDEQQRRVATSAILTDHFKTRSRIMAFVSAKGGVGKTMLSVNLGVELVRRGKSVVLIDLDLAFGDVTTLLGISDTQRTIYTLLLEGQGYAEVVHTYLTCHETGLYVLPAPTAVEQGEYITPNFIQGLLRTLRKDFDYVIVDTANPLQDMFFSAIDAADDVFLVSTADLASVRDNRRMLNVIKALGYDLTLWKSLYVERGTLPGTMAQEVLSLETYSTIGFDSLATSAAINLGIPVVLQTKRARIVHDIQYIAQKITSTETRIARDKIKTTFFRRFSLKAR